jgi:hypothetical protein
MLRRMDVEFNDLFYYIVVVALLHGCSFELHLYITQVVLHVM